MKKQKTYSVIIPAYNAEQSIAQCLHSLLAQPRDDVEIIVINDGSSDHTEDIVQDLSSRCGDENCIICISKENGGVSSARNLGLNHASGEFITFVDSDDFVSVDYFEILDQDRDSDLLVFQMHSVQDKAPANETITLPEDSSSCFDLLYWIQKNGKMNSPCNKRFKRSLIADHSIQFMDRVQIAEDHLFCLTYALKCSSISVIPETLYYIQTDNPDSLSKTYRKDMYISQLKVSLASEKEISESSLSLPEKKALYTLIDYLFSIRAINSIAEEFKVSDFNYLRDRKKTAQLCRSFSHHIGGNTKYRNHFHRTVRFLLDHRLFFLTYLAAYILKYGRTRQYRKAHVSH